MVAHDIVFTSEKIKKHHQKVHKQEKKIIKNETQTWEDIEVKVNIQHLYFLSCHPLLPSDVGMILA